MIGSGTGSRLLLMSEPVLQSNTYFACIGQTIQAIFPFHQILSGFLVDNMQRRELFSALLLLD
jgi:hypothetical protein